MPKKIKKTTKDKGLVLNNKAKKPPVPNLKPKKPKSRGRPKNPPGHKPLKPMSNQDLAALKRKWYARLKTEGFKDIEIMDRKMRPSEYLHGHSLRQWGDKVGWQDTYHYYARLRNYLTHVPQWHGTYKIKGLVARMYADGQTFASIVSEVKAQGLKANMNKWHVHHIVKEFVAKAYAWNHKDPRGLDFVSDVG